MNPTRILLIHTEETRTHFNALGIVENEPLETEILYTVLKQAGYPVRIYDPDREPACFEELLSSFAPDLVYADGVVKQVPYMLDYMQRTKAFSPKTATILGGVFAEHNYRSLYKDTVDYISRSYDPCVISALASLLSEPDFPSSLLENLNGQIRTKAAEEQSLATSLSQQQAAAVAARASWETLRSELPAEYADNTDTSAVEKEIRRLEEKERQAKLERENARLAAEEAHRQSQRMDGRREALIASLTDLRIQLAEQQKSGVHM